MTTIQNYAAKERIVLDYIKKFSVDMFIETGTYNGGMVAAIAPHVKNVCSIELDEKLHVSAQARFKDNPNVHIFCGDSARELPKILSCNIKEPCLFWLDAHYSAGITAKGDTETPILAELKAILESPYDHIVLIDDARLYTGENDWPELKIIQQIIHKAHPDWGFEVKDDIIRIHSVSGFISMTTLGQFGQFGNQLFQYAAMKAYARHYNLRLEIPESWVGREIFIGCDDPPITSEPREQKMIESETPIWMNNKLKNCDIKGYFQYHTRFHDKDYFRSLFRILPELTEEVEKTIGMLKSITGLDGYVRKATLVGIHIRRGDYCIGNRSANIAPSEWYLKWLKENWNDLFNPVLFIASDEIDKVVNDFKEYKPYAFQEDNFLCDHYVLRHCDCLLISNSTFSFTAAMLNETGKEFLRPDFEQNKLITFDPWDSEPTLDVFQVATTLLKLHLGCGEIRLNGYVNMDVRKTPAVDLIGDIRDLPFADDSVEIIETYHAFEHFPVCLQANVDNVYGEKYEALIDVLKEWRRVLKKDGQLVIEMPDLDKVVEEYRTSTEERKDELLLGIYGSFRNNDESDYHRWGANEHRLRYMLEKAGFRYIRFCEPQDYHVKTSPCLRVEAVK